MSPGQRLQQQVDGGVARIRRVAAAAVGLAVVAVVPTVLLVAWAAGRWTVGPGPLLLVGVGIVVAVGVAYTLASRWVATVTEASLASAVEADRGLPDGSLRSVLELGHELPAGVSGSLVRRTESLLETQLKDAEPWAGRLGDQAKRRRNRALSWTAGLTLLTVVLGLATPERARAAWTPLLQPVAHLTGPVLPPLRVAPGDTVVDRGSALEIEVEAPLRTAVTLHWRTLGDVPGRERLRVTAGMASGRLDAMVASTDYWVTAEDGAASDTFQVEPREPVRLAAAVPPVASRSSTTNTRSPLVTAS